MSEPHMDAWEQVLRKVGLGAGLHEPLRTQVIAEAMEHLTPVLAAHNRKVAAKALRDAGDAMDKAMTPAGDTPEELAIHRDPAAWLHANADRIEEVA